MAETDEVLLLRGLLGRCLAVAASEDWITRPKVGKPSLRLSAMPLWHDVKKALHHKDAQVGGSTVIKPSSRFKFWRR